MLSHILYCNDSLLIPLVLRQVPLALQNFFNYKLEYFTEFYLFQAWTWRLTMLQIYVTLWGRLCVCVCVYLELLSHFLPIKINLLNISPILINLVYFKNMAWATSFATRASRKFIYLPYRASGKKSYCHTLGTV